ncbi:MAG: hypothetical protein CYG59_16980 [Chloroflexi bacterium]|nr:MAG: hypothetical protein CYG59_16980 [Chloroflexota bacterium]
MFGRAPQVRHVLWVMSKPLKPIHPGVSRIMHVAAFGDQFDQTFDSTTMLERYPIPLTRLEEFIRERVAEAAHSQGLQKQVAQSHTKSHD